MVGIRRPPAGVRYRRALRRLREADRSIRLGALIVTGLLVADLISLGAVGPSTSRLAATGSTSTSGSGASGALGPPGSSTTAGTLGASGATSTTLAAASTTAATLGSSGVGSLVGGGSGSGAAPGVKLTASDRGVTPTSITVVFPWPNLGAVGAATGIDTASESNTLSIATYVNDINAHGGILGRKIVPEVVGFNPLDDASMRALCLQWTQDQQVFAVVDSDAWHDDEQLCITQEGHTPLISGWTAVPLFTQEGAPNLWWTGPDTSRVVENLVPWAIARGILTPKTKFGILASDRQEDTIALNQYLIPTLARYGLKATDVEISHYDSSDGADSADTAPLSVERFRADGVTTLIPIVPFLNLATFLETADDQNWDPVEALSDYESELEGGLGLADEGFQDLQNQVGPTSFDLGNSDDPRGYDAQAMSCYDVWQQANPGVTPPPNHYVEATGTAMTWCQNIRLFAAAARLAGPDLTRAGFDAAMGQLSSFPGTVVPFLSYSPTNHAGPHEYRTVEIHENGDGKCPLLANGQAQGSCWLILSPWKEMQTG